MSSLTRRIQRQRNGMGSKLGIPVSSTPVKQPPRGSRRSQFQKGNK